MKRKMVMALLTVCPAMAFAQGAEVTVYGVVDMGVQALSSGGSGSKIGTQSGNAIPSHFGLRGREDLGDGYAATFRLEAGMNVANGQQVVPGTLFNRYATIGLQTPVGSFDFGKQYNLMYANTLFFDATLLAQYSVMSANLIPVQTSNPDNSIRWTSPNMGGLTAYAQYGFGEQSWDDRKAGQYMGFALNYKSGPFAIRGVYEQAQGSSSAVTGAGSQSGRKDQRYSVAASYQFDQFSYYVGWAGIRGDLELSPRGNFYWLGMGYQTDSPLSFVGQVMHYATSDDKGSPNWYILGATYRLSKRTSLYTYAGYYDNRGAKDFVLNTFDFESPRGHNQRGLQVGVTHIF